MSLALLFNQTWLNKRLLSNYTHRHTHPSWVITHEGWYAIKQRNQKCLSSAEWSQQVINYFESSEEFVSFIFNIYCTIYVCAYVC